MLSSYKKGEIFEINVLGRFSKSVQTILEFLIFILISSFSLFYCKIRGTLKYRFTKIFIKIRNSKINYVSLF